MARFNNCMLNREDNRNFIKSEIQEFWEHNEGSIEDHGIIWDAFKSVLRGRIIQRSSLLKKAENQRLLKLDQEIKTLEKQHMEQRDSVTWGKLNELKCELNDILNRKTEFALFCTRQKYFERGERAGKGWTRREICHWPVAFEDHWPHGFNHWSRSMSGINPDATIMKKNNLI